MNRKDFQRLARVRLKEARVLRNAKCWDGCYYLCGYVVECGLKACIARRTRRHDFPIKKKAIEDCYSHELGRLLKAADLGLALEDEMARDHRFRNNWDTVKGWSEESRYATNSEANARGIIKAVTDPEHGVMQWIRRFW